MSLRVVLAASALFGAAQVEAVADPRAQLVDTSPVATSNHDPVVGDLCARTDAVALPATHVYHLRGGGEIVFVAVTHVIDTKDPVKRAAIYGAITSAIEQYRPDLVLVEGASAQKSSDESYISFLVSAAQQQAMSENFAENLFAVKVSADKGIKFAGWDMSPREEYIVDISGGYDIPDVIGAHLLRARQNPFKSPSQSAIEREVQALPMRVQSDPFDFAAWYRTMYGEVFDGRNGTPCGSGVASQIIRAESIRRTRTLANLLLADAKPGKVVMVEAGAAHWLALRAYLDSISRAGA